MKKIILLLAAGLCLGTVNAAFPASLQVIVIEPISASVSVNRTQQFTATGFYSDSTQADITNSVTWNSSEMSAATITPGGLATGKSAGTSNITASLSGVTSLPVTLTVTASLQVIITEPFSASVSVNGTQQFTAFGLYSDSTQADITNSVTWNSSEISAATIAPGGLATGKSAGTSNITASLSGVTSFPVTLTVTASSLVITSTGLPNGFVNEQYGTFSVITPVTLQASGGAPPYAWSLLSGTLPSGLSISTGGVISGSPVGSLGASTFTVQAQDTAGAVASQILSIAIVNGGLFFTCLPSAGPHNQDLPYSTTCEVAGGTPPYVFSSTGLPAGLSLSSTTFFTATVSGIPASTGPYAFAVQAMDASTPPQVVPFGFIGTLYSSSTILVITSTNLPQGIVGEPYSAMLQAADGRPPYTWVISSGSLPAGLTLMVGGLYGNTWLISGTPTIPGVSTFTVQVFDQLASSATATLSLVITSSSPLVITSTGLPQGTVGQAYSATLSASGGVTPYTWSIVAGTPAAGLSISTTGIMSGSPTMASTTTFTVQVNDSAGANVSQAFTIVVNAAGSGLPAGPAAPIIQGFVPALTVVDRFATLNLSVLGTVTQVVWTFTPAPEGSGIAWPAQAAAAQQAAGSSYTTTTQTASLSLNGLPIALGRQNLTVVAYNGVTPSAPFSVVFTLVSSDLASVKVHPSPWRSDRGWPEQVTFDGLPPGSTVKIFTISARWVAGVTADADGQAFWNLKNNGGSPVASGIYIYLVTDAQGNKTHGKFGIIR